MLRILPRQVYIMLPWWKDLISQSPFSKMIISPADFLKNWFMGPSASLFTMYILPRYRPDMSESEYGSTLASISPFEQPLTVMTRTKSKHIFRVIRSRFVLFDCKRWTDLCEVKIKSDVIQKNSSWSYEANLLYYIIASNRWLCRP